MAQILVTGSASGLGDAICKALQSDHRVIEFDQRYGDDVRTPDADVIRDICRGTLDVLVNCAGVNQLNWLADVHEEEWDTVMDVNAKGIFMMTQAVLPMLEACCGTVVNIVSNASHVPMRCSLAYNASKAAAHMMTLQLARELSPDVTVFGISPNKLRGTGMSREIERQVQRTRGWSPEQADAYQQQSLLSGLETPPEAVAEFLAFLLKTKTRHQYLTGCVLPYGA
jgi:Dehydrogenases with different specificities (related to short-chain alcohol dehydrogenases)